MSLNEDECQEPPKLCYPGEVRERVMGRLRISKSTYYRIHHKTLKPLMRQRTGSTETLLDRELSRYINICKQQDLEHAKAWAFAEANYND